MCLHTRDKKPRVAKRDIVCRKYLGEVTKGEYKTPNLGTPVTLNEVLVAKPDKPQIKHCGKDRWGINMFSLNGGAIHARLFDTGGYSYGTVCKKAIIPAGTKYWLDSFGREIAAERLLITDEDIDTLPNDYALDVLEDAPELNGIHIGDYYLTGDSYARPTQDFNKDDVIGQVVGFHDGEPLIAAIDILMGKWDRRGDSKIGNLYSGSSIIKDFSGEETMAKYKKEMGQEDRFEVFNLCLEYHSDKNEEWYLPAMGEMTTMLNNTLYINVARIVSGVGQTIRSWWFWTCSEWDSGSACSCSLGFGKVRCNSLYKDLRCGIVPFFASKTSVSKKKKTEWSLLKRVKSLWK